MLVEVVFGVIAVGSCAITLWAKKKARADAWERELRAWTKTGATLALPELKSERVGHIHLQGSAGDARIGIETAFDSIRGPITRFTLSSPRIAKNIHIEGFGFKRTQIFALTPVGDPAIDDHFAISGPEDLVLALFDGELRHQLERFDARALHVSLGTVVYEYAAHVTDPEELRPRMKEVSRLAHRLELAPEQIGARLLFNAKRETNLEVRRRLYKLLLKEGAPADSATEAAKVGIADVDPLIRMLAALQLGPDFYEQVERIAREEELSYEARIFAFSELAARAPVLWGSTFIDRVMNLDGRSVQRAVLRSLVEAERSDLAEAVARATKEIELAPETWSEIAEALGFLGVPTVEPLLLEILRSPMSALRMSAIGALARIGSVAAVEPLHAITRDFLSHSVEIREAAKQAITEIQSRIENGGSGRLSLVENNEHRGAVSLPTEGGELSYSSDVSND